MEHVDEITTAELAVIGSAILSGGRIMEELDFNPADFRHPALEFAYRTIDQMRRDGNPIDALTVTEALKSAEIPIDPMLTLKAQEATPSPATGPHYAAIVTEHATRRRLADVGRKVTTLAETPGDVDAIVEESRRILDNAAKTTRTEPVQFVWETIADTVDRFADGATYTPTPWPSLNELIGGLRPGALYTIGARPGVGKSVVGVMLATELAKHGGVAMLSLEMSQDDVNKRILAHHQHVPMNRLMDPDTLTPGDYQRIAEWSSTYRAPLAVSKSTQVTITEIRRFARNVHRRAPLAGVVVDYLQLMAQAPSDKRARHEFVADMSRQLKLLAMDMSVPVVMLSQLNRQSESREDKMPRISDLRESGAVEQDSDVVILLHRDITGPHADQLKMAVAKNRHGRVGTKEFTFWGHYSEIRDDSTAWTPTSATVSA